MMKQSIVAILLAGLVFTGAACNATNATKSDGNIDAKAAAAISAAKKAQKEAKAVGYEWRDIGKMIKKAEAAAKKGDTAKAVKLAKKAEFQGKIGPKQAELAKSAGPRF